PPPYSQSLTRPKRKHALGTQAEAALAALGRRAVRIATVLDDPSAVVILHSRIGGQPVLDLLSGEQLPRIC
ncbi:MAG: hypothetical protein AAB225_18610, partial [Acidobacteriota bacterium]